MEFLDFVFGHFGAAINYQIILTGQQVAFEDFRLPNTKRSRLNGLKFKNDALGDIGEACQLIGCGSHDGREITEMRYQFAGNLFDITARNGAKQNQLEQFMVGQSLRPGAL